MTFFETEKLAIENRNAKWQIESNKKKHLNKRILLQKNNRNIKENEEIIKRKTREMQRMQKRNEELKKESNSENLRLLTVHICCDSKTLNFRPRIFKGKVFLSYRA